MKYFTNVRNLEELRKEYKRLLKHFHPDCPTGSDEITKKINVEYEKVFSILKESDKQDSTRKENANEFNENYDRAFREILNRIINYNINIEIIGSWIWLSGNTFEVKEALKAIGFRWIVSRKAWAWHAEPYRKTNSKQKTMDELREIYGSSVVKKSACCQKLTAC